MFDNLEEMENSLNDETRPSTSIAPNSDVNVGDNSPNYLIKDKLDDFVKERGFDLANGGLPSPLEDYLGHAIQLAKCEWGIL